MKFFLMSLFTNLIFDFFAFFPFALMVGSFSSGLFSAGIGARIFWVLLCVAVTIGVTLVNRKLYRDYKEKMNNIFKPAVVGYLVFLIPALAMFCLCIVAAFKPETVSIGII